MLLLVILMWIGVVRAQTGPVLVDNITLDCGTSNWTLMDTWCIRPFDQFLSWSQANRFCGSYGSDLVSITDRLMHVDVTDHLDAPGEYWIGLALLQNLTGDPWEPETDIASQLQIETGVDNGLVSIWSSGETGSLFQGYWGVGEPDLSRGSCVYIGGYSPRRWAVGNCDIRRKFICQHAACLQGSFRCNNGVCINDQKRCDGINDCGDDSDEMSCPLLCRFHLLGDKGQLTSPGYPGHYQNGTDCSWVIETTPGTNARLQFIEMETEPGFDEVVALVGGRTSLMSEYVDRYSGNLANVSVVSSNNLIIIKFTADQYNTSKGFTAQWDTVTHSVPIAGMQLVANMSLQEVTSPFYPSFYISQTLEWIISPMYARQVVTLQVLDLDLDEEDYIIVRHDNIDGEVMAVYNTTGGPGTVISVSQLHLMMKVKTFYPRRSHRGFKFSYIQGCDVTVNDDKGVVSSPGYGVLNYPAYQNCSWTITAQQSRQLTIIFDENFHLEDDKDFLQVYDGLNDTGVPLHYNNSVGFSGRKAPPPLTSTSGRLYINLRSNSLYQYTGYRARFSIGCPDPGFNNNTEIIPYPSTYAFGSYLNVSCESGYVFLEEENQRGDNTSVEYVVMECLYGGVWNVARIPQCQARYCGVPPVINRGYLLQGNGVQYGATVTYVCEDGYIPSNRLTLACQGNGTWEPAPECHAVNCSVPPDVANATFVIQEGTGWNFGSRILYTCDSGFHLSGAAILFCLANGTWNEDTPSCNRISCPTPDIDHGQLDTPGPVMRYGDKATLDCAAGFTVVGTSTVTCLANQTLGTLPSCEDVDECGDRTVCDVTSQECVNTVGSYSCRCKLGYADNGTHVCQDIDECATNTSLCSDGCDNFGGGYRCTCTPGYVLYTVNGTEGYYIPIRETGERPGGLYHLNHTCVHVTCDSPPTLQDGAILNKQTTYHYGDSLDYKCNLGFVLSDYRIINCQTNGSWSYQFPTCTVATCPPDGPEQWTNTTVPATAAFPSVLAYLDVVILTCNVSGMGIFNRTRQCLYDQPTNTYRLIGDSYECGEINCGSPADFLNGEVQNVTGITYGNSFFVRCGPLFRLHGNSSYGDEQVRCAADGYWDYGNLICLPITCPDPGKPLDGSFVGTNFSLGGTVSFSCDDSELQIVGNPHLECVLSPDNTSLLWNGTIPACKDVTGPNITGCPAGNHVVDKYDIPMFPVPLAVDNLGISNFTVSPSYFYPTDPVLENTTVVYTATDLYGNTAECTIDIIVFDESVPTIQCPSSFTAYLTDQPYNITISAANFSVSSSSSSLDFGPDQVHVSSDTLDSTVTIYGNITDSRGNFDTCWFQIRVEATCHPAMLTSPVNGQLNCTESTDNTRYRCEGRCNQGYYFYEDYSPSLDVFVTECTIGGNWTHTYIPACVSSLPTSFKQVHELVYQPVGNESVLTSSCLTQYITTLQQTYSSVSAMVTDVCGFLGEVSRVIITGGQFTDIVNNSFTGMYTLEFDPPTVEASHDCVQATAWIFTKTTSVIEDLTDINGITGCANLTAGYQTLVTNEQMCDDNVKTRDQSGTRVCLVCPPGTFKTDNNSCELCPLGAYNDREGMSSCSSCPLGTWTETEGSFNSSDCKGVCRNGLYSSTRLPPCTQCPDNSYPVSSHSCQACPAGTKYIGTAAYRNTNCLTEPCQFTSTSAMVDGVGGQTYTGTISQCEQYCEELEVKTTVRCTSFSYNTLLQECILHHGDIVRLEVNSTFDHYSRTCYRLSDSECYCVLPCLAGNRSFDGFQPCTECPKNYYTDRNQSTDCEECPPNTMTLGTGATSNSSCVDAEQMLCPRCRNGATCRIIQHDYVCACPMGYQGRDCDQVLDPCLSRPCYHGATCTTSQGTFTCTCPVGTTGDTCEVDLDDCGMEPCLNGGICVDGLNSFTCVCLHPYYGNNCELDNSTDICVSVPCENGGSCTSVNNLRRKCVCPPGFKGQDCEINVDECASSPCLNGGLCVDGDNAYTCTCPLYQGERCETPRITCDSLTCGNADECYYDYRTGLPQCICNPGYILEPGQSDCSLVDLCASSPCMNGGTCSNVPAGIICHCPLGYGGSLCQHDLDDCVSLPCANNGTCVDGFNNFTCLCLSGYSSDDCSSDVNECLDYPCNSTGTQSCNNTYGGFICQCNPGYSGSYCSVYTDRDPCGSNPCLHGGVCGGLGNDFTCDCRNGWTGQQCETLVNYCNDIDNPCRNAARCVSLQDDFFCRCENGSYGRYCDDLPDLCSRLDPCLNHATCTADREMYTGCSCTAGFFGTGCKLTESQDCSSSPCLNGGTCSMDPSGDILCACVHGYDGNICQHDVNECENATCPGQGTCVDGINRYFCRCPQGKLPPDCLDVSTLDYDLCFDSSLGEASAFLPFGIPLNEQFMTIRFWVKFSSKSGTGTFFSMFEQTDPDPLSGRALLFSLDQDGLHTSEEDIHPFGSYTINNGEWHLVVITWDTTEGKVEVRANTVRVIYLTDYQRNRLFSQFYWVTLGNEIPLTSMTSVPGGRFQGCISQVNIFGRILETNGQLPRTMSNTFSADSLGDVLQWVEFELLGLVNRIRPSTRLDPSCTSCSVRDKSTLNITCPGDIYLESANLYSSVTWSLPQHDEYLPLTTNMLSGTVLPPGKHTVMYSAADINNNTAVCSFRVFIRDNKCELPDLVGDVTGTCQSDGIDNRYTGCSLSCPTPHKILSRATPLYTCGPLGWWDIVAADRTCSPITPTCGNITSTARVNLNVRLVYPAALTICNLVKNSLETYIREHIRSLDQHWDRKLCVEETCQDIIISINCTSPSPTVEFVISNITMNITSVNGDSKSPEEMFIDALLDQNRFHFEELIPNTNPVIDQSTVESVSNCPDGYLLVNSECVTCGLGMYLNTTTLLCEYCPKGFYYNSDYENNSCRACPEGTTTECPAAVSVSQCHAICQNGSFFNITSGICELCPLGTYQNESGQFQCLSCQYGQTTHQNGTTDVNSCFDMCASGHEISEEGSCRKCEVGSYRGESDGPLCILCPAGITTPKNGSETVLNCTIVICSPGHRANDNNTHCERCPIGEFQPRWNQISCLPCPENTTTEMEATVNETMCETFCASGYERLNETCEACPIGQYKDNSDGLLGRCVTCSSGYVTPNIASTSSSNCSLYNCTEGSKINANNSGCELCPNGEYQPEKYQTDCLPCPNGTSTLQPGATQCEVFCPSGQQLAGGVCEPCPIGYYKNNTEGLFEDCKPCPVEFITAAEGATNEDLCVIGNCTSGQYLVNTTLTCTACPTGTYQPEVWQTECIKCPPDTTTQQEGTTQRSQCFLFCDAGNQGRNMTCEPCPVGYYKSVAGASPCSVCPPGNRTKSIGSTDISDCNIGACDPGTFLNENTCELCPYGQYQSDPWQDDCLSCPSQTTTYKLGAALVSDCIMACAGGFEYNTSSGQCEMCDRGFYRDNTDPTQAQCQPCPIGTITAIGQISNSILFCFMANCTVPGEYRDSIENTCRPCPRGQYQDRKWQDSCQKCPDNYTTFTEGATSTTQCRLACIPGYHEDNGTCAPCPHGTYRQSGQWCQNCSDNWTTHSNAATDVNQCVPNCTSGQYYSEVNRECALCPPGTYQAEPYQTNCTECVPGTTTRTGGATTSDSCWSLCHNLIHNCSEHAQCQMIGTNATCTCRVGYIGDGYICQHRCNTAYCLNGGTCVWDIDQSIGCQCHLKYTGDKCQFRQAADSIGPQTWTVVVGSVVGGVTFLAIFIIVSVLIGVTYRRYLKNKAMTPKKSLANGTKSKQFATRANLGNYGGGPPFHSPEEKTNNFKWSSTDGKIADTKYINMDYDSNSDEAVYQPPSEQP